MFDKHKRSWRQLKAGRPGTRFQSHQEAQQKSNRPAWVRPVRIAAGTVMLAVGLVALPAPGPGILVIALGAAVIAGESRLAARALDWGECRLREAWTWAGNAWETAPWPVKLLTALLGTALAIAVGWLTAVYILRHWFG